MMRSSRIWASVTLLAACCLFLSAASAAGQNGATVRTTVFHGVELPYVVVGDLALHGDIILGTAKEAAAHAPGARPLDSAASPRSLAPYPREVLWPQGVVPYVIDADVPRPEWIREAITIWNRETVIRFVERTTERDYLRFAVGDGCFGVFGRGFDGGERIMPVGPGGCTVPITLHELGHAIGMWHENQRKDRDHWLTVFRENINPIYEPGTWHPHPLAGPDIGPYDYRSVMHYPFYSEEQRRHGDIIAADTIPPGMPFGDYTWELSPGDIDSVARLYGRVPSEHVISTNPAGLEIIVDGQPMIAPARLRWTSGSEHTVEVRSPQFRDGARFVFGRWSDDGARAHAITATGETTLYQASFIAQHRVTTSVLPPGAGSVKVSPETPDGYYTLGTAVEVSASPNHGFRFLAWETHSDYSWGWALRNRLHGESSNPARTLVADGLTYGARFTEGPILRIESNVDPVEVAIGGGRYGAPVFLLPEWFSGTTTVDANMDRSPGHHMFRHRFRSWSNGGDAEHTLTVPADEDTTLRLTLDTEHRLETRAWYGHEIETIPASDDGFYPQGAEVRLRAVGRPPAEFIGWSGGDVFGADPTDSVTMDTGRYVEAVFAAGTSEILPGEPVGVSLRWGAEPGYERRYVRVPPGADEIEIRFSTNSLTEGAEAGLFVTHHGDPWPWDVEHADADRILRGGVETVAVSPGADGWPAAYFILVRTSDTARGEQRLEGTLVAKITRDRRNRAPVAVGTLPPRKLALDSTLEVNLSRAFMDPDGDPLTYAVASSAPDIVTVRSSTLAAVLTAVKRGAATIQVTATDPGGLSTTQAFAVTVEATVRAPFTDDPLVPGVTPIKTIHFTELRARIDARRQAAGLVPFRWTDRILRAGVTRVRLVHLLELRSALLETYAAVGRVAPDWTDAAPAAGRTPLRAAHVMELRAAVAALE